MVAELSQRYTGAVAASYERDREKTFSWLYEDVVFTSTLRQLNHDERIKTAIDIPCGTGRFHRHYSDFGIDCVGVDISADMLAIAEKKGMKIQEADFFTYMPKEPVDLVVCVRFLNYLNFEDQRQAWRIISQLTKRWAFVQIDSHEEVEKIGQSQNKWFPTIAQCRENVESNGMQVKHWHASDLKKKISTNILLIEKK